MSICGKDGGIAPIAPGPLSSIKESIQFDISVILSLIEPKVYFEKTKELKQNQNQNQIEISEKSAKTKKLPQFIHIDMYCHPVTREQRMKII
jgi:hypothetical protein